jgi:hypothetical protein
MALISSLRPSLVGGLLLSREFGPDDPDWIARE